VILAPSHGKTLEINDALRQSHCFFSMFGLFLAVISDMRD